MRNLEESDGFEYAIDYIAKFKNSRKFKPRKHIENYVQVLSYGGLVQPSDEMKIKNQRALDSLWIQLNNTGPGGQIVFRNKEKLNKRTFQEFKTRIFQIVLLRQVFQNVDDIPRNNYK